MSEGIYIHGVHSYNRMASVRAHKMGWNNKPNSRSIKSHLRHARKSMMTRKYGNMKIEKEAGEFGMVKIGFTMKGIEHLMSDARSSSFTRSDLMSIDKMLEEATYLDWSLPDKGKEKEYKKYLYYKWEKDGRTLYFSVGDYKRRRKNGNVKFELYSIRNNFDPSKIRHE